MALRIKMGQVRHLSNPKVSDQCFALTSRMLCSRCDADISTGVSDGSICLSFCDEWFLACMSDYVDPYLDPSQNVPFCKEESLVCSPVAEIAQNSRGFCEYMGFKVMGADDIERLQA